MCSSSLTSFGHGVDYSMTLISTIGYGAISPMTQAGKIVTVVYGIIGIPIFFATMFKIGTILSSLIHGLFGLMGMKSEEPESAPKTATDSSCVRMIDLFNFLTSYVLLEFQMTFDKK